MADASTWIGGVLSLDADGLTARIKDTVSLDIRDALERYQCMNVIPKKDLLSFTSRVNHAAGLLVSIRPFLQSLWPAIYAPSSGPSNKVWKRQVEYALSWLEVVFVIQAPGFTRRFSLLDYRSAGPDIEIGTDASPWGLGGWLSRDGSICNYFHCPVIAHDTHVLSITEGSCESQQILECLAILVAIRAWLPQFDGRLRLTVRVDNLGAFMMVIMRRPPTAQLAIVSREIAMGLAHHSFLPHVTHTPGFAHKLADGLSRMYGPKPDQSIIRHPSLAHAVRTQVPDRGPDYYLNLHTPRGAEGKGRLAAWCNW